MLQILLGAAILGFIIAVMEEGEFPGWGSMLLCVLAALVPAVLINSLLPPSLFFVGLLAGAGLAGIAISAFCGMSLKRAAIAAGIYLVIQTGISISFRLLLS